jgi:hypothetical protein
MILRGTVVCWPAKPGPRVSALRAIFEPALIRGRDASGAAASRVSQGRVCTGLGGGPRYREGIYVPD